MAGETINSWEEFAQFMELDKHSPEEQERIKRKFHEEGEGAARQEAERLERSSAYDDYARNQAGGAYDRYEVDEETGQVTWYATNPQTGEEVSWTGDATDSGWGPRGHVRDERRNGRERGDRFNDNSQGYGDRMGRTLNEQVDDPWQQLADAMPTQDALMGGATGSELGGAQADAQSIAAQRAALVQMQNIANGGMTAQERAAMQQSRQNAAQYEKQQRDAIMQQAAMRGMSGSGTALAAQLSAAQGGANRVSQANMQAQAMAQQRALQAMQMQAQTSGQMRGQSFQEDATRRSAVDDFNRQQGSAAQQRFANQTTVSQGQSSAAESQRDFYAGRSSEDKDREQHERDRKVEAGTSGGGVG